MQFSYVKRVLSQVISLLVGGTDILIRLEIEQPFIQLSNNILIGWITLQYVFYCLSQNVARPVFPICAQLRQECNQTMLVFATVNLEACVELYDLRLCLMVFHSCNYLLSKISV